MPQLRDKFLASGLELADKRMTRSGQRFIVDDRGPGDYDAADQLFYWFCRIFVDVVSDVEVTLTLNNTPVSPEIIEWARSHHASGDASNGTIVLALRPGGQNCILGDKEGTAPGHL